MRLGLPVYFLKIKEITHYLLGNSASLLLTVSDNEVINSVQSTSCYLKTWHKRKQEKIK